MEETSKKPHGLAYFEQQLGYEMFDNVGNDKWLMSPIEATIDWIPIFVNRYYTVSKTVCHLLLNQVLILANVKTPIYVYSHSSKTRGYSYCF